MNKPILDYEVRSKLWTLRADYTDDDVRTPIPAGYTTNLASIPRCLWSLETPFELSTTAPLIHDFLYDHAGRDVGFLGEITGAMFYRRVSKWESDKIFRRLMKREGVKFWRRQTAYWAVRLFAGGAWKKCLKENTRA